MSEPAIELRTHEAYYADQLRAMLRAEVAREGSQKAVAAKAKVTPQFLHDVLNDRRRPSGNLLAYLGFADITVYYRIGGWK